MDKKFNIKCETLTKISAVKLNLQLKGMIFLLKWLKNKVVYKTSRYKCFLFYFDIVY